MIRYSACGLCIEILCLVGTIGIGTNTRSTTFDFESFESMGACASFSILLPSNAKQPFTRRQKYSRRRLHAGVNIEQFGLALGFQGLHFGHSRRVLLGLFRFHAFRLVPVDQIRRHLFPLEAVQAVIANPVSFDLVLANQLEASIFQHQLLPARKRRIG